MLGGKGDLQLAAISKKKLLVCDTNSTRHCFSKLWKEAPSELNRSLTVARKIGQGVALQKKTFAGMISMSNKYIFTHTYHYIVYIVGSTNCCMGYIMHSHGIDKQYYLL